MRVEQGLQWFDLLADGRLGDVERLRRRPLGARPNHFTQYLYLAGIDGEMSLTQCPRTKIAILRASLGNAVVGRAAARRPVCARDTGRWAQGGFQLQPPHKFELVSRSR